MYCCTAIAAQCWGTHHLSDESGGDKGSRIDPQGSPVDSENDWHYAGSSYVIYLQIKGKLIPWVVWSTMPVAFLVQAAVVMLTRYLGSVSAASSVSLIHADVILDADRGLLSDYPVLEDEVVTVQVTVPRGGRVPDRAIPVPNLNQDRLVITIYCKEEWI